MLSSDDPVRVFQRFSTLNAISNGRAEVIVGRGSFTESFPLFGYDLSHYEALFEEKLEAVRRAAQARSRSRGPDQLRTPLTNQIVYPPIETGTLRTWVGVGGSPESVVRAARYGLPLMLAIIGGSPQRFRPYVDLYRQIVGAIREADCSRSACIRPGTSPRPTNRRRRNCGRTTQAMMNRIGAERGWPPISRAQFEREAGPDGALFVGSPETVAAKIVRTVKAARPVALRSEVQQRHAAARQADDEHRAVRHEGRADGARASRLTRTTPLGSGSR